MYVANITFITKPYSEIIYPIKQVKFNNLDLKVSKFSLPQIYIYHYFPEFKKIKEVIIFNSLRFFEFSEVVPREISGKKKDLGVNLSPCILWYRGPESNRHGVTPTGF